MTYQGWWLLSSSKKRVTIKDSHFSYDLSRVLTYQSDYLKYLSRVPLYYHYLFHISLLSLFAPYIITIKFIQYQWGSLSFLNGVSRKSKWVSDKLGQNFQNFLKMSRNCQHFQKISQKLLSYVHFSISWFGLIRIFHNVT